MKYCTRPFNHLYVDFNGHARFCSWTSGEPLGNVQDGLEKLWNSKRANDFRHAILNGDFFYCRPDVCPMIMNDTLPDNPGYKLDDLLQPYPLKMQLAYDYQCNLSCPSCRKKVIIASQAAEKVLTEIEHSLSSYFNRAQSLDFGGHGDPLFSKHTMSILEKLQPENKDFHLSLQTNGLFFTPETWQKIKHLAEFNIMITISIDSLNPAVYGKLRRGGNLQRLLKNIEFIASLRKVNAINKLNSVMVVQDVNFMEIPQFVDFCFKHGFDRVNLENLYNWGTFTDKEYFAKNLINPNHPNHTFYKELLNKALQDPRVFCWAGTTNRSYNNWAVMGKSAFAICDVAKADCLKKSASLDELSHAIWNKDYVFIINGDKYEGTVSYEKFHSYMGIPNCVECDLSKLYDNEITAIVCDNLNEIFTLLKNHRKTCKVIPILKDGKIIAKALPCD